MYIKDVKEIVEVNSSYVLGELRNKFIQFAENFDSLGMKAEDIEIDLGGKTLETQSEEDSIETEVPEQEQLKQIPGIWVLINDNDIYPVFRPIKSDCFGVDYDKAVKDYGIDIIRLKTDYTEITKQVCLIVNGQEFQYSGTMREIFRGIIDTVPLPECRQQIMTKIEESFLEPFSVHSFSMSVPEHRENVVIGIK